MEDEYGVIDMDISEDEVLELPEEYPVTCNKCNEEFNGYDLDWTNTKKVYLETSEIMGGLRFYNDCIECPECGENGISTGEVTLC